jgi:hypothetical protein
MRNLPLVYFDASNRTFHHVRDLGLSCGVPQYGWFTQGTGAKNWRWLVTEESERKKHGNVSNKYKHVDKQTV